MENAGKPEVKVTNFKSLHITPVFDVLKRHRREAIYATLSIILITLSIVETFSFLGASHYILIGLRIVLFVLGCAGLAAVFYQLSRPLSIKTVALRCLFVIFGFFALGYALHEVIDFLPAELGLLILVILAIPLRLFAWPIFYNLLAISLRQEKFTLEHLKHGFWSLVIWELLIVLFGALLGLAFILVTFFSYVVPYMEWFFLGLTYIFMLIISVLHIVWLMAVAITAQDKAIRDARQREIEELGFSFHIQKRTDYSSIS